MLIFLVVLVIVVDVDVVKAETTPIPKSRTVVATTTIRLLFVLAVLLSIILRIIFGIMLYSILL